ncbi:hypothetical protein ALPO108162_15970 [Alicyclobacillus pomorum]
MAADVDDIMQHIIFRRNRMKMILMQEFHLRFELPWSHSQAITREVISFVIHKNWNTDLLRIRRRNPTALNDTIHTCDIDGLIDNLEDLRQVTQEFFAFKGYWHPEVRRRGHLAATSRGGTSITTYLKSTTTRSYEF